MLNSASPTAHACPSCNVGYAQCIPAKKVNTLCTRAIKICIKLPSGLETTHIHSLGEDEHIMHYFIQIAISCLQVDVTRTAAATSSKKQKVEPACMHLVSSMFIPHAILYVLIKVILLATLHSPSLTQRIIKHT